MTGTSARTTLRSDVQGLRAVAVLTVIASHAQFAPMAGGFVGVDVFFVISGFLITQLLIREVDRNGRVSIADFYARRARRILPAATLVLIVTAVASALWLGPIYGPGALEDTIWAGFFAINVHLGLAETDYFATDLPPSPVQHYWSLAVEEQFYLVWPLVILAVVLLVGRWGGRGKRARRSGQSPELGVLLITLLVICGVSLWWSISQTTANPTFSYFSPFTRAWELGLGALGAIWLARRQRATTSAPWPRIAVELLAAVGLAAIIWACLSYDEATPFPSWRAAAPGLGSLAVLVAGGLGAARSLTDRLLSLRPLTVTGDWSYSLYLWHWPLLVIPAQYLARDLTWPERWAAVAATFVLAWLTFRFVENPFRRASWLAPSWRGVAVYPVTVVVLLGVWWSSTSYLIQQPGGDGEVIALEADWKQRYGTEDQAEALLMASVGAARDGGELPASLRPELPDLLDSYADVGSCDYFEDSVRELCPRGDVDSERSIVVVGDSHARHWINAFDAIGEAYGYRTYYLVRVQCTASLVTPDRADSDEPDTGCVDFRDWAAEQIAEIQPELLVMSTSAPNGGIRDAGGTHLTAAAATRPLIMQGYVDALDRLKGDAERTVLLLDIPRVTTDPATCLGSPRATLGGCLLEAREGKVRADQKEAARAAGVEAVETEQWFCLDARCPTVVGDMLSYRDSSHMTNEYATHLAESLAGHLGLRQQTSPADAAE
ncbi:acyltransferase family protein [Nocardioides dubius]|uniref:SGNH hydrolase domain-containing protein n=1 Tax=Nocardioides dubius TaxID=317019 RepID=A0ABN1U100_9ACTN